MEAPEWVRDRLVPADTPEGIRDAVVEDLQSFARSRAGFYRGVALVGGVLHHTTLQIHDQAGCLGHYRECEGRPISKFGDVSAEALSTVNGFGVTEAEELRGNLIYRTLLGPAKVRSILAMTAAPGGNFAGWVGCYRLEGEESFEPEILVEAQRRASAYIHCLDAACALDPSPAASRAVVVLDARGEVRDCCSEGRVWLANPDFVAQLREAAVHASSDRPRFIHGAIVRFMRLEGADGPSIHAELVPAHAWRLNPIVALSLQKRRIAGFAAVGASATEIGQALGISANGVRAHLKDIYAQLDVGSRVELAECIRTLGFPT